jgi:hypothetical protein
MRGWPLPRGGVIGNKVPFAIECHQSKSPIKWGYDAWVEAWTLKTALGDLVHNAPPCFSALRGGQSLPQNLYGCFREYEVIFLVDIKTLDSRHRVEGERRHIETISVAFVLSDDFRSRYDEHDKIDIF